MECPSRGKTLFITLAAFVACIGLAFAMQPLMAWAIEAPPGVPATVSGNCRIGATWMVGSQSFFAIPSFQGQLEGCVPSSAFECLDHTAAAPENVDATYEGVLHAYDYEAGWIEYYVIITPPGVTDGVTRNDYGLTGYQRVGGTVRLHWSFNGGISLEKRSANTSVTDGNGCYSLAEALYGVFTTQAKALTRRVDQAVATYTTDARGTWSSEMSFTVGEYFVAEITAPKGYALDTAIYPVSVEADKTTLVNASPGYVSDAPITNPVTLWAAKTDAETPDGRAQGAATLQGARFEIRYYDGYYSLSTLPAAPTRSWVVATDASGKALVSEALKVSGDEFYRTSNGAIAIPLGTVTVREVTAPNGYLIENGDGDTGSVQLRQITPSGTAEAIGVYTAPGAADYVKRGGVRVGKVDRQNGGYKPQGAAMLEGAVFSIVSANAQPIKVDGTFYSTGRVVKTIETKLEGGSYIASTEVDCLPYGYYTVYESESSEGYLFDRTSQSWSRDFQITEDGQMVDLTGTDDAVSNQVIRGDFAFSKVDGQTMERLAHVPFLVTSQTTGEAHVIVTDENGMVSTASDWNAHTQSTNANDDAIAFADDGYEVDEELLDAAAGIWFNGRTDIPCAPSNDLGALPFDTYTVEELGCQANAGYMPVRFTVVITRDSRELDLGTVDDSAGPIVGTTLSDDNGVKLVAAGTTAVVTDTVEYANLDTSRNYTVEGQMHLVTEGGEDGGIIAASSAALSPRTPNGSVEVEFAIDTSDLAGARIVAFERLVDEEGATVATHEDLLYEGQTVRVPAMGTTIANATDGDKRVSASETVSLVDNVSYQGLTPGDTYMLTGYLHIRNEDGSDGGIARDAQGQQITSTQSFTAHDSTGATSVLFTFTAPDLAGSTLVAFEELSRRGNVYATHADIADEGQSVYLLAPPPPEQPPEEETPVEEKNVVKEVVEEREKLVEAPAKLPNTGDALIIAPLVAIAAAAIGLFAASACVKGMQKRKRFDIERGRRSL